MSVAPFKTFFLVALTIFFYFLHALNEMIKSDYEWRLHLEFQIIFNERSCTFSAKFPDWAVKVQGIVGRVWQHYLSQQEGLNSCCTPLAILFVLQITFISWPSCPLIIASFKIEEAIYLWTKFWRKWRNNSAVSRKGDHLVNKCVITLFFNNSKRCFNHVNNRNP